MNKFKKAISWYVQSLLFLEQRIDRNSITTTLFDLEKRLKDTTESCFRYALESYEPRSRSWNYRIPSGTRKQKLENFYQNLIFVWKVYRTPETKFLAKAKFYKDGFFEKGKKKEPFWLLPNDHHTKIPDRAWDAWCLDYDLKNNFTKEIYENYN